MGALKSEDTNSTDGGKASAVLHQGRDRLYAQWRIRVFAITWIAYVGLTLTRKPFAVAKVEIGEGTAVGLSASQLAWIDGAFLIAYAAGQAIWGIAGDRWGVRVVLLIGMFCSAVASVAMGAASTAVVFGAFFFLQGLCQSCGWGPLLKNIGSFFSQRERGTILGLWGTNYAVGGLIASVLAGWVGQMFGWRWSFFISAGGLLLVIGLFLLLQRNRPEDLGLPPIEEYHQESLAVVKAGDSSADEVERSWTLIGRVLSSPMVWFLGLAYFFVKPVRYAMLFWGPKYVSDRLGSGMGEAGLLSGLFELAGAVSIMLAGFLSDRLFGTRRIPVPIICLTLLAVLFLFLEDLPHTRWTMAGCMFLLGLLIHGPDMLIGGIAAVDFGTRKGASTASGLINGLGSIGAIVGGVLPGVLIDRWGWKGMFDVLAAMAFVATLLLLPKWNALPPASRSDGATSSPGES